MALTAETVNVYGVPLVRPVMAPGVSVNVSKPPIWTPPSKVRTRYSVMGLPPVSAGGFQVRDTCPGPGVPDRSIGASGAVGAGTTPALSSDSSTSPDAVNAATVKV